jgi:putative SOS response-associated peptidase YedK
LLPDSLDKIPLFAANERRVEKVFTSMCSRYSLTSPHEAVRAYFAHKGGHEFPPRPNIAPTQPVAIIRNGDDGEREMALVRWGLLPPWVKDPREFSTLINARSETITEKPSFRGAIRHKRCLVPADGFYEWKGEKGAKRPFLVRPTTKGLLAMAGIYEHWLGADGSELETMAILTCAAGRFMAPLHDRMPVILKPERFDVWLDCKPGTAEAILGLLQPAPDDLLEMVEMQPNLNDPKPQMASKQDSELRKLL